MARRRASVARCCRRSANWRDATAISRERALTAGIEPDSWRNPAGTPPSRNPVLARGLGIPTPLLAWHHLSKHVQLHVSASEPMASKACLSRLQKEYQRLSKDPLPDVLAEPRCADHPPSTRSFGARALTAVCESAQAK